MPNVQQEYRFKFTFDRKDVKKQLNDIALDVKDTIAKMGSASDKVNIFKDLMTYISNVDNALDAFKSKHKVFLKYTLLPSILSFSSFFSKSFLIFSISSGVLSTKSTTLVTGSFAASTFIKETFPLGLIVKNPTGETVTPVPPPPPKFFTDVFLFPK